MHPLTDIQVHHQEQAERLRRSTALHVRERRARSHDEAPGRPPDPRAVRHIPTSPRALWAPAA